LQGTAVRGRTYEDIKGFGLHVEASHLSGIVHGNKKTSLRAKKERLRKSAGLAALHIIEIDLVEALSGLAVENEDLVCIAGVRAEAADLLLGFCLTLALTCCRKLE
jgi:hypothetical protein